MPPLNPFRDELPVPDTVAPAKGALALAAHAQKVKLHKDLPGAHVWAYRLEHGKVVRKGSGASYLGPTVVVERAETVSVAWRNAIPEAATLPFEVVKVPNPDADTTLPVPENEPGQGGALPDAQDKLRVSLRGLHASLVTHLHGARVQADSDGWPDNTILPGQAAHYTYHNDQAATMLWYHDHAMHVTRLNVYAGLAGAWLIRDDVERGLHLPSGRHEIPLIIQDRNLDVDEDGAFTGALLHKTEVDTGPAEFFGPYTLVNGKIWPRASVEPQLYRLRVLNGANARTFRLILLDEGGESVQSVVQQIGCDQGLMRAKAALPDDGLLLAPAERVDLLIDFTAFAGKRLYLWNTADAPFSNDDSKKPDAAKVKAEVQALVADPLASLGGGDALNRRPFPQVMRFDVGGWASPSLPPPPDPLTSRPAPVLGADTPIRIMGLVENPADPSKVDGTSMLVFYEFLSVAEKTPPADTPIVSITFWHPGKNTFDTGQYWKAAEEFYDTLNWRVHLGATELWYIVNLSPDTHPIHVHLVDMTVSKRFAFTWDGEGEFDPTSKDIKLTHIEATDSLLIEPGMEGPKDTVRVNPGEMLGIAMTFGPYPGRYMYHCHILEHEDHDMMRPFVVVPRWVPHHDH